MSIICSKCGRTLPDNTIYCSGCGQKNEPVVPMKYCPSCGNKILKSSKFCSKCGAVQIAEAEKQILFCMNCKKPLPDGAVFCSICGTKATVMSPVSGNIGISVSQSKKCKMCGADLKQDAIFCGICGAAVNDASQTKAGLINKDDLTSDNAAADNGSGFKPREITYVESSKKKPELDIIEQTESSNSSATTPEIVLEDSSTVMESDIRIPVPTPVITPVPTSEAIKCPKCGKELKPGVKFCNGCGALLDAAVPGIQTVPETKIESDVIIPVPTPVMTSAPTSETIKCPKCGKELKPGAKFCNGCGAHLDAAVPGMQTVPVTVIESDIKIPVPTPVMTSAPTSETIKCPKCGKELKPGAKFCNGCGAHLNAAVPGMQTVPVNVIENDIKIPVPTPVITPVPTSEEIKCPKCGKELKPGAKFCNGCGVNIDALKEKPLEKVLAEEIICKNCGAVLKPNMKYCYNCAAEVKY